MFRRKTSSSGVEASLTLLDFVTICLGATLLLVVMVPNQTSSKASVAERAEALLLVRDHFANVSRQRSITLTGGLDTVHPSLPAPQSTAPYQISGKSVTGLPSTQLVRRLEVIVEVDPTDPLYISQVEEFLKIVSKRGIGWVNVRAFDTASTSNAGTDISGLSIQSTTDAASFIAFASGSPRSPTKAAINQALASIPSSPTPSEPIVFILRSEEATSLVVASLASMDENAPYSIKNHSCLVLGGVLTQAVSKHSFNIMSQCKRADYVAVVQ